MASASSSDPQAALAALEAIEHATQFVASDVAQLLGGLQAGLQSLSHTSIDYMTLYRDTALHARDEVHQSVAAGRSFIDKCARLDERMEGIEQIASQLTEVDRALCSLETAFEHGVITGKSSQSEQTRLDVTRGGRSANRALPLGIRTQVDTLGHTRGVGVGSSDLTRPSQHN
mmetsp:Transcript_22963/g.58432  ORF Transcript_22963/g.58432 Transcript_22963/m.58432 type:complete len:173 (-) Transcript_22963:186-704(-)